MQGRNRISLAAVENRTFCIVMQLAKRRSLEEVKALMRAPETLAAALQRVRKQVGSCARPVLESVIDRTGRRCQQHHECSSGAA